MKQRDLQPEVMDDPSLPVHDHLLALKGLARLNRASGIESSMFRMIRQFLHDRPDRRLRVLDVASGSGDVPIAWARRARREGWRIDLTLVDNRQTACEEQQRLAALADLSVKSIQQDCLTGSLPNGFDLVTCSLFFHHLTNPQVFQLLQSMQAATSGGLLLCDLERNRLNLELVRIASRCLTRSPVVHHDAVTSVRAAFTVKEFQPIASSALSRPFRIKRVFPCRFVLLTTEATSKSPVPAIA
ncbi:MAG: methyltransferase domain-containing protein [Rubripirellula sp.]|nr:methyltransferase domain-containing protein [Rubripirellula sp.]